MSLILPINLDSLLHHRSVESERVEFKATWDPHTTGPQVLKTICAFANDLHNLNGGYVVIGVAERNGRAVLPPSGLRSAEIEDAQRWIRGQCNRLDPAYQPVLSPETVDGRDILVIWAAASDTKPHRAPDGPRGPLRFWVRLGSETVDAERSRSGLLPALMQQTARVSWDDRQALNARVEDLRGARVREYLRDVESGLLDLVDETDVYRRMRIVTRVNDHDVPRNIGLLFFSDDPAHWFPGARIEVVQFTADRAGDVLEERTFSGGLAGQLRDCLQYLENLSARHLRKQAHRPQVRGWVSYPLRAVRETLVNAVYHRSYEPEHPEPVKVYLYPDRLEITSYPGPVPGIDVRHLQPDADVPAVPARNRRIGELLKELGLAEGRLTGLPKVFRAMTDNGSPAPRFDFDEQRTYFRAVLPAHPEYAAITALRDAAHLRALGESQEAFRRIESGWRSNPASAILTMEIIRLHVEHGKLESAEEVFEIFRESGSGHALPHVVNMFAEALADAGKERKARQLLEQHSPDMASGQDAIDAAILARRLRKERVAHRYFERAGEAVQADPRALLEFAQSKIRMAGEALRQQPVPRRDVQRRLLGEARPLLERVIQLDSSPGRHAWAWRELARIQSWLGASRREVERAYGKAIELLPDEPRFKAELGEFKRRTRRTRRRGRGR